MQLGIDYVKHHVKIVIHMMYIGHILIQLKKYQKYSKIILFQYVKVRYYKTPFLTA